MARALDEQRRADTTPGLLGEPLGFEDRLGLQVDREAAERDTKRLTARLKFPGSFTRQLHPADEAAARNTRQEHDL